MLDSLLKSQDHQPFQGATASCTLPAGGGPLPRRGTPQPVCVQDCVGVWFQGLTLVEQVANCLPSRSATSTLPLKEGLCSLPLNQAGLCNCFSQQNMLEMVLSGF